MSARIPRAPLRGAKEMRRKELRRNNSLRRAALRAHHQNVVVAPDLKYDLPMP
jgi:hypothetical protein